MIYETRIACLIYADDVCLLASSEQEVQHLYDELQEMFRRDGMLIGIVKTEASLYTAWLGAKEWLEPQFTHPDGTLVQESLAFRYLSQVKERQGAKQEVGARIHGPCETWRLLKGKIFRNRRFAVQLRVRL